MVNHGCRWFPGDWLAWTWTQTWGWTLRSRSRCKQWKTEEGRGKREAKEEGLDLPANPVSNIVASWQGVNQGSLDLERLPKTTVLASNRIFPGTRCGWHKTMPLPSSLSIRRKRYRRLLESNQGCETGNGGKLEEGRRRYLSIERFCLRLP